MDIRRCAVWGLLASGCLVTGELLESLHPAPLRRPIDLVVSLSAILGHAGEHGEEEQNGFVSLSFRQAARQATQGPGAIFDLGRDRGM